MRHKFYVTRAEFPSGPRWILKQDGPAFLESTFKAATRGTFGTRDEAREARRVLELGANGRIREAMKKRDREVLAHVRREEAGPRGCYVPICPGRAWHGALERLEAAGRIRFSGQLHGYVIVRNGKRKGRTG